MNKGLVALLGLGGVAAWYLAPVYAAYNLVFSLTKFKLNSTSANLLNAVFQLQINNTTLFPLNIHRIDVDVFLDGEYLTKIYFDGELAIPAYGYNNIEASIPLYETKILATVWNKISTFDLENMVLSLSGKMQSRNRSYPFSVDLKLSSL